MTLELPPKAPRPWDPDAAKTGSALLVVGVLVSVVMHGGIPMAGVLWPVKTITQLPVTMDFESIPLPPAEELVESPDEENVDGDPDIDDPDIDAPDEPEAPDEPDEPAAPDDPDVPDAPDEPDEPAEPDEPSEASEPPPSETVTQSDLAQRIAERDQKRAAWLAERAKRLAERNARRDAAREAAAKKAAKKKGGAPEGGNTQGEPDLVYLCNAEDKGVGYTPRTERPISSWMTIVPTAFAHFESRPGMMSYVEDMKQVYVPRKRIGLIDFAAPDRVLQLPLDKPAGTTIAIGRLDARCLIGLKYRPRLFPIELKRLPVRIIDKKNNTVSALVNIYIYKDASIDVVPFDKSQPALPFKAGALKNSKVIARNIEDHFQAARLANAFAELFGMKKPSSIASGTTTPKKTKKKKKPKTTPKSKSASR